MILNEDVAKRFAYTREIENIDAQIEALNARKKVVEESLKKLNASLLSSVKEAKGNDKDYDVEFDKGLFLTYFAKEDITWLDDAGLLKKLQENKADKYIKVTVKTTTSIDKNALKKAFKTDEALREQYKDFYGTKLTEYITVTDKESHDKMLEHIEDNKKEENK